MRCAINIQESLVFVLLVASAAYAQPPKDPVRLREGWQPGVGPKEGNLVAPVFYRDPEGESALTMLVLSNREGAAAVVITGNFAEPGVEGVAYRYRYESFDGKTKKNGTGQLFEQRNAEGTMGGVVQIDIAGLAVRWSPGDSYRGWLYYSPDTVRVNLADGRQFESRTHSVPGREGEFVVIPALDLQRFKPQGAEK